MAWSGSRDRVRRATTLAPLLQRDRCVAGVDTTRALSEALFAPLDQGLVGIGADQRVLVLGASEAQSWRARAGTAWCCEQSFKPWASALTSAGLRTAQAIAEADFDAVLIFVPRQRERARALFASAARRVREGGIVLAAQANQEGARSAQADLAALFGPLQHLSQRKCRVFWTRREQARIDTDLLTRWRALGEVQRVGEREHWSRPGLFAWDRIDTGSALLAAHLPGTLVGRVADLGAAWGYLSCVIAQRCSGVRSIDLYEAEALALEPARRNLDEALVGSAHAPAIGIHWHDVTEGLPRRCDAVVMNPPFHEGRADAPELGQAFIDAAADALDPPGELWLVANRHLPYEARLARRFEQVQAMADEGGFKVLCARGVRA